MRTDELKPGMRVRPLRMLAYDPDRPFRQVVRVGDERFSSGAPTLAVSFVEGVAIRETVDAHWQVEP